MEIISITENILKKPHVTNLMFMINTLAEVISCTGMRIFLSDLDGVEYGLFVGHAVPDMRGFTTQNLVLNVLQINKCNVVI